MSFCWYVQRWQGHALTFQDIKTAKDYLRERGVSVDA